MAEIVAATSVNRALLRKREANDLAADFTSHVADFNDMKVASFQVWYKNHNAVDGEFEVYVSNYSDLDSFGKYPKSRVPMDADCNSLLWNINVVGFRYGLIKYFKGASMTAGDVEIVALGKK